MLRADVLVVLISLAVPSVALASPDARAARLLVEAPTSVEATASLTPSRTTRLLAEGGVSAGLGVVLPLVAYGGFTAMQSFVGFFAGFLSATVLGVILAPIGVILAGRLLGAEGGVGRGVVGAVLGVLAGLLIGLPLATLPGAGYLLGLGLLWALPSVGALVAYEWGRTEQAAPTGAVVVRF